MRLARVLLGSSGVLARGELQGDVREVAEVEPNDIDASDFTLVVVFATVFL